MPIYEYRCEDCGERFSKLVRRLTDQATKVACEACGSPRARKLVSQFAAHGLESQVDSYTGGDESDLPAPKTTFGREDLAAAKKLRESSS
jgi:putative FmdB family regulatory protein